MKILFVSRGRGMGHAIPDMALADRWPQHDITFASYGTGYATLVKAGRRVIDMGLPENPTIYEVASWTYREIAGIGYDVVLAHEEPGAIWGAKLVWKPAIYLAEWLWPERLSVQADGTARADRAIIWCEPGIFPAQANTEFVGPLVRLDNSRHQITTASKITTISLGGHAGANPEILALLHDALKPEDRVYWLGASARAFNKFLKRPQTIMSPFTLDPSGYYRSADLVITAGNRGSTSDAAYLGVPTLCLSPQTNPMDDLFTARLPGCTWLSLKACTPDIVRMWIERLLANPPPTVVRQPTIDQIAARIDAVLTEVVK